MDVESAFLHGSLDEELYMLQVEGFTFPGKEHLGCKLRRSLYWLKQAPCPWYRKFVSFMLSNGVTRNKVETCVRGTVVRKNRHIAKL